MGFFKEFKEFAIRGNIIDLAIAVVLGAAFIAIVNSVVEHILMPLVGILTGGVDIKSLSIQVGSAVLKYGMFLQAVISFIIIAFLLFLVVKAVNRMKKEPPPPAVISSTDKLLMEIRDALRNRN
jgi:large conductance mechanosensitive channel